MRRIVPFVAAIALSATAFAGPETGKAPAEAASAKTVEVGKEAPDFALPDAMGKTHKLSEYRGKIVVLEWTNPDCPYVMRHYREGTMKKLNQSFQGKEVVWLAVNTTHYNKPEDSLKWTKEKELPYPTLLDSQGRVARLYEARTTPHMFVIDPKGVLVYNGAIDDDQSGDKKPEERLNYVAASLTSLLKGGEIEKAETRPYGCSIKYAEK